jgi:O-antigen/teichoic acid export membrane protein
LGYYQIAYNLVLYVIQSLTMVAGRVLFPALAQLQDDHARLRAGYLRGVSIIAVIVFPVMLGAMAIADPLVRGVLGMQWLPAIPVIVIFAPVGVMQCLTSSSAQLFTATGRTDVMFRWGMVTTTAYVGSFFAGLPWGIRGVAVAYLIANVILFVPSLLLAFRSVELGLVDFFRPLWIVLGIAIAMFGIVWTAGRMVSDWRPAWQLAVLIPLGAVVYAGLMAWIRPEPARYLFELVYNQKKAG